MNDPISIDSRSIDGIISPLLSKKESNYSGNDNEHEHEYEYEYDNSNNINRICAGLDPNDTNDTTHEPTPPPPSNSHSHSQSPSQPQPPTRNKTPQSILLNYILFSTLFSANHGAVVSCISLASARLGNIGTTQNTILYLSYTFSALFGSTYVIKCIGPYFSILCGMTIYCLYVLSYVIVVVGMVDVGSLGCDVAILGGGFIGGIGGGFLWTAQGSYFAKVSEEYAKLKLLYSYYPPPPPPSGCTSTNTSSNINSSSGTGTGTGMETEELAGTNFYAQDLHSHLHLQVQSEEEKSAIKNATSLFAGIFASIYLLEEVVLRLFSSFVLEVLNWTWSGVFTGYASIAVLSTVLMYLAVNDADSDANANADADSDADVPTEQDRGQQQQQQQQQQPQLQIENYNGNDGDGEEFIIPSLSPSQKESTFYRATITFQMLLNDPKMKYMIPINAVFGLCSVFIITFVSGEVLRISLNDNKSVYVGVLSSITSATAGIMSIIFGVISSRGVPNGLILIIGCLAFFMVAFLFIVIPDLEQWNLIMLSIVYAFQGIGRSTFEGALKAEFALVFTEKEGAFGNLIFQNGSITTIGFFLASHLYCKTESTYCIKFNADGLLHNVLIFEILIVTSALLAILGYWRAKWIYKREQEVLVGGRQIADIVL